MIYEINKGLTAKKIIDYAIVNGTVTYEGRIHNKTEFIKFIGKDWEAIFWFLEKESTKTQSTDCYCSTEYYRSYWKDSAKKLEEFLKTPRQLEFDLEE